MCVLFFYMMNRIVADRMDSFRGLGKRPLIIPLIIINVITQSLVRLVQVLICIFLLRNMDYMIQGDGIWDKGLGSPNQPRGTGVSWSKPQNRDLDNEREWRKIIFLYCPICLISVPTCDRLKKLEGQEKQPRKDISTALTCVRRMSGSEELPFSKYWYQTILRRPTNPMFINTGPGALLK